MLCHWWEMSAGISSCRLRENWVEIGRKTHLKSMAWTSCSMRISNHGSSKSTRIPVSNYRHRCWVGSFQKCSTMLLRYRWIHSCRRRRRLATWPAWSSRIASSWFFRADLYNYATCKICRSCSWSQKRRVDQLKNRHGNYIQKTSNEPKNSLAHIAWQIDRIQVKTDRSGFPHTIHNK